MLQITTKGGSGNKYISKITIYNTFNAPNLVNSLIFDYIVLYYLETDYHYYSNRFTQHQIIKALYIIGKPFKLFWPQTGLSVWFYV